MLITTDPRTGTTEETGLEPSTSEQVAAAVAAAVAAHETFSAGSRASRVALLRAIAEVAERQRAPLVTAAARETGLSEARLDGELSRSAFQFRMFAEVVREGAFLEAAIDHAGDTVLGAAPDVRRMLIPVGPVAVFGSSNFPFAFSVLGGDTASAIAAGCPVILKAHSSHLLTSVASFDVLRTAAREAAAPEDTFGMVLGQAAGRSLVQHHGVRAASFTGSLAAARSLQAAIDERADPIPLFCELSSINPLVVTPGAAAARGEAIAQGLCGSVTGSAGQLCTKPGIAFVPTGADGDAVVARLARLFASSTAQTVLNSRIADAFAEISGRLEASGAAEVARGASAPDGGGITAVPTLLQTDAASLGADLAEECFGPLVILARYSTMAEVVDAFHRIPSSLTATLHSEPGEGAELGGLLAAMTATSGRLVFNGYPTGVRVGWAQNHGGPWPATNSQHTSVGATAVRRFQRPIAFKGAPQEALPAELRDDFHAIPRRIDGVLVSPSTP